MHASGNEETENVPAVPTVDADVSDVSEILKLREQQLRGVVMALLSLSRCLPRGNVARNKALDYLVRNDLMPSPLRSIESSNRIMRSEQSHYEELRDWANGVELIATAAGYKGPDLACVGIAEHVLDFRAKAEALVDYIERSHHPYVMQTVKESQAFTEFKEAFAAKQSSTQPVKETP